MYSLKTNLQLNNTQSLMGRYAGQADSQWNNEFTTPNNDLREPADQLPAFLERRRPARLGARQQRAEPDHRPGEPSSTA